jgi:hypothetical protein
MLTNRQISSAREGMQRVLLGMIVASAVLGSTAGPSWGGTYTVQSCRDSAGRPAATSDASGGWTYGTTGQTGLTAVNRCPGVGRDLVAAVNGPWSFPIGARAWWRFVAPPHTVIDSFGLWFSGYARPWNGSNQGVVAINGSHSGRIATFDGQGSMPSQLFRLGERHDTYLELLAACDAPQGFPDCAAGQNHAEVHVERSEVTLIDTEPPSSGTVGGSAPESRTWVGVQHFAFGATDQGGGVYQVMLDVDGVQAFTRTIDDWGGRCVDITAQARYFLFPQPCLTSLDALVPVDSAQLPPGDHEITLRISDAAGNLRTVYSGRKTIVAPPRRIGPGSDPAERGAANGENASDDAKLGVRWTRTKRATLIAPYGRRNVIRGRLTTAAGAGIRSAKIELVTAIDGRRGAPLDKGGARTRRDGRFTLILPRNASSRALMLRYRSHVNDTVAIAEATLGLKVKAGVKLGVTPRTATQGRSVRITGRLVGGPIPRSGKVVELQARNPGGRWITFRTVRASRRGRFSTRYTFRQGGPALYLMRARVRAADDYPYATGASHVARVRVR